MHDFKQLREKPFSFYYPSRCKGIFFKMSIRKIDINSKAQSHSLIIKHYSVNIYNLNTNMRIIIN